MKEIKFRAWHEHSGMIEWDKLKDYVDLGNVLGVYPTLKVMQYTGLKDKNGKEVYEGDIINYVEEDYLSHERMGKVVFEDFAWRITGDSYRRPFYSSTNAIEQVEIIGNVYENSELLK